MWVHTLRESRRQTTFTRYRGGTNQRNKTRTKESSLEPIGDLLVFEVDTAVTAPLEALRRLLYANSNVCMFHLGRCICRRFMTLFLPPGHLPCLEFYPLTFFLWDLAPIS